MRRAEDFPAPFGPSSVITCPVPTAKLILRKTRRPARSHVKSCTWTRLRTAIQLILIHMLAAVDGQCRSGDETRVICDQENHAARDFPRPSQPADRYARH